VDTPLLKKLKVIQAQELRTWKGLPVEFISRPGIFLVAYVLARDYVERAVVEEAIEDH